MAFKYIKCPECGETMKLEADKDLIFCEYCEVKLKMRISSIRKNT